MSRSRNYLFTSFEEKAPQMLNQMKYLIYQQEVCPNSGRLHWQCFTVLKNATGFAGVKRLLQPGVHLEEANGTLADNISYCSKSKTKIDGTLVELGDRPKPQGDRTDLTGFVADIPEHDDLWLLQNYPSQTLRYRQHINFVRSAHMERAQKELRFLKVYYIWGTPGIGKSRFVYENISDKDYYKPASISNKRPLWFDGYTGQDILWLDDVDPTNIDVTEMLNILDIYPLRLQVKGSFTHACYTQVYITSNYDPSGYTSAIYRRFTHIIDLHKYKQQQLEACDDFTTE